MYQLCTMLKTNFIPADILSTNFNLHCNPFMFLCLTDVQYLPDDDEDRSKHVGVMTNLM